MAKVTAFCCARTRIRSITLAVLVAGLVTVAGATPVWTPERVAREYAQSGAATAPRFQLPDRRPGVNPLDEIAYFHHYRMLCDFLVGRQFTGAGWNHGGMIEGESLGDENIIETDNTQEAIREWSQYAIWTGDTATYAENIRDAWTYLGHYPAWGEGGVGIEFYAAHNCGWGFEAERKYRQAYGDTSKLWYADSCAAWVKNNPINILVTSTDLGQLDPLAEGLAIGGMYPHAVFRGDTSWSNFALRKGRQIRQWFESNPRRLYANETWALCGGTALWGLCESVFAAYPDSGATWLATYGDSIDIWQSTGTWNHSANAWYCNAQWKAFELTGDSTYYRNAVFITDSLIGLDRDGDGGIYPGVGYNSTDDCSWVSCYMGWMGMERLINRIPAYDVAALRILSPVASLPHLAGDSLIVEARVMNVGMRDVNSLIRICGETISDSVRLDMPEGLDTVITFTSRWVVPDGPGLQPTTPLQLIVTTPSDTNSLNDTLITVFDIRHGVNLTGMVVNMVPAGIPAQVKVYHDAYPDSAWLTTSSDSAGHVQFGTRPLMAGLNHFHVSPAAQYMLSDSAIDLSPTTAAVQMTVGTTQLALIDDSPGDNIETYYQSSLDTFGLRVRTWETQGSGVPGLTGIPKVIWFTGNATHDVLDTTEQAQLESYLLGGGRLILTGQNITDDLGPGPSFLTRVLQCSTLSNNTGARQVVGIPGNEVTDSLDLWISGTGGARNQSSASSIVVLEGAQEIFRYPSPSYERCGIVGTYGTGRYVFLSFGLEAVSGSNRSSTRTQVLSRLFRWLGEDSGSYVETRPEQPMSLELAQNYPNPFNPSTTIRFIAPPGSQPVTLTIFNVLGQEVRTVFSGVGTGQPVLIQWDGRTASGRDVSSGLYVYRLRAGSTLLTRTLQLVR
jgi:hypothetical protein